MDGIFRDAAGGRVTVEIRSTNQDILVKAKLTAADYWQRVGIAVDPMTESDAQRANIESRATFPGFLSRRSGRNSTLKTFRSSEAQLPEKGYVGSNVVNYMNPELDVLIDRFLSTIAWSRRIQAAQGIVHHLIDQVVPLPTFYDVLPRIIGARVQGVPPSGNIVWAVETWDVTS